MSRQQSWTHKIRVSWYPDYVARTNGPPTLPTSPTSGAPARDLGWVFFRDVGSRPTLPSRIKNSDDRSTA